MRATENDLTGRRRVVMEMRAMIARPYRDFITWGSLYDVEDRVEQGRQRDLVSWSLDNLHKRYLPRSMWLEPATRKKIEAYIEGAWALFEELSREVGDLGYARARANIVRRVTRELGPLRREAETSLGAEIEPVNQGRWRLRRGSGR